jgi:hypothetical protein
MTDQFHTMKQKLFHLTLTLVIIGFVSCGGQAVSLEEKTIKSAQGGNHLSMKLNDKEWVADSDLFGAFHPKGYNKAIIISGSKGPKNKDEQAFTLNLFNVEGPGTYHIKKGNADLSVVQLANLSPENFMYGSLMGFDLKVTVTKAMQDPTVIEATFEGSLSGNASDTLKVTAGRFSYRE